MRSHRPPPEYLGISACFPDRVAHIIVGVHMCMSKNRHTRRHTRTIDRLQQLTRSKTNNSTENFTGRADNYQSIADKQTEYVHT